MRIAYLRFVKRPEPLCGRIDRRRNRTFRQQFGHAVETGEALIRPLKLLVQSVQFKFGNR